MLSATSTVAGRWPVPIALYVTVVAFAAGSSSVAEITRVALRLRWVTLFALAAAAVALVGTRLQERRSLPGLWFVPFPGALVVLAAVSAVWSVDPSLTLRRTASFAVLLVAAGAVGCAAALDHRVARRVLVAVVAAAATVAMLGLIVLAWSPSVAVQGWDGGGTLRYRGFGANPNTAPMLYAVALPVAGWLALSAYTLRSSVAAGAATLLFAGSVIASLSRGALLASLFSASLVALTLIPGVLRRAGALMVIFAVFLVGNTLRFTDPGPSYPPELLQQVDGQSQPSDPGGSGGSGGDSGASGGSGGDSGGSGGSAEPDPPSMEEKFVEVGVRPEDEIGHPVLGLATSTSGSGRAAAWKGALADIRERPILGAGFGTEALAFTDHWYFFQGANPENAYLGLMLQLGGVGLILFLALGFVLLFVGADSIRRSRGEERGILAATLGAVVAGAVLMLSQSYIYSVGNIATPTFWICASILAAIAGPPTVAALRPDGRG